MNGTALGTLALLLILGSGTVWFYAARRVRLPANRSGFVAAWLAGAAMGALALTAEPGWIGGVAGSLAVLGGALLSFTVSISRQKVAPEAVAPGAKIPVFSAPDEAGEPFDSARLAGHPVLIKFFRGHW